MNEKPLERLNYFNGQRLQAADFRLEQDYHIRVRRWLNRSLYTSGIASGLQVYAIKEQPRVRVMPGLAIDHLGREIILLDEQIIDVVGGHHEDDQNGNGHACTGPYLTIRYREEVITQQDGSCMVSCDASSNRAAWGGPARILADAVLELNAQLPNESSGKIPLACLTLAPGCGKIESVDTGVRRYIGSSAVRSQQYALEGTRDLDGDNPATIIFHLKGQQPTSVTLYLRSEEFPSLFYQEMGRHTHTMSVSLQADGAHSHELGSYTTASGGSHTHAINTPFVSAQGLFDFFDSVFPFKRWALLAVDIREYPVVGDQPSQIGASFTIGSSGSHLHAYGSQGPNKLYTIDNDARSRHTHSFSQSSNSAAGVDDASGAAARYSARSGAPLKFLEGLQVEIDDTLVTDQVLEQIRNNRPQSENWSRLGLGTGGETDPLAHTGTGAIKIDFIVPLGEGEHTIKLALQSSKTTGARNGGRVHFNLYVE
jgi:hypothetical protein